MIGTASYCAIILLLIAGSRILSIDPGIAIAQKIKNAKEKISDENSQLKKIERHVLISEKSLVANQQLQNQPNWSILLKLVSIQMSDDIILIRCNLSPYFNNHKKTTQKQREPKRYYFIIEGQAKNQGEINDFILKIEKIKIFDRVDLVGSKKSNFSGIKSIHFILKCHLDGSTH